MSPADGAPTILGLYNAATLADLDTMLAALPLFVWMRVTVTALEPHPNDPSRLTATSSSRDGQR